MEQLTVDLTAEDAHHVDTIVEYYAGGRWGITISRADAVRIALRELYETVKPGRIINDCGFTESERWRMAGDSP